MPSRSDVRTLRALLLAAAVCLACGGRPPAPVIEDAPHPYDVVIIGSGGGGLAAAAALTRGGMKVVVLEQAGNVGGYMSAFERPPYTFEVSLHAMDGTNPGGRSRLLFERLGIWDRLRPVSLDVPYRAVFPKLVIDVPSEASAYRVGLEDLFPKEREGIGRFFSNMNDMYTAMTWKSLSGAGDRAGAVKAITANPKFWHVFFKYGNKTFADLLDDCTSDRELQAILAWLGGYLGARPEEIPAMSAMAMWSSYHRDGFSYFVGGSRSISEALADVVLEGGGEIVLGARAVRIETAGGLATAVITRDGTRYRCDHVVSNASAEATLLEMVGRDRLPRRYVRELEGMRVGPSIFQVYLGVAHDYTPVFGRAHTISVFDSYNPAENLGLGPGGADPAKLGYYLTNFSVVDPEAAPPGKNVIEITTYLPYGWRDRWRTADGPAAHRTLKEEAAEILVRRAERILPGLSSHLEVREIATPLTMERFTGNPQGATYGWAAGQSMGSGTYTMRRRTPIPNLYLASAWSAGGGQSNVMSAGVNVADDILLVAGKLPPPTEDVRLDASSAFPTLDAGDGEAGEPRDEPSDGGTE